MGIEHVISKSHSALFHKLLSDPGGSTYNILALPVLYFILLIIPVFSAFLLQVTIRTK